LDTLKGIASFFTDPKGANDLLSKAMSLHNRHSNILVEMKEVQDLIRGDKQRFADMIKFLDKYGFIFTQLSDRAAILVGGWAVFKTTYEKTKSLDQAYKEFDDFVDGKDYEVLLSARQNGDISLDTFWSECRRRGLLSVTFDPLKERQKMLDDLPGDDKEGMMND
jgi:hypothetical protein